MSINLQPVTVASTMVIAGLAERLGVPVCVSSYGALGAASLATALNEADYILLDAGIYSGPIDITQSNKTLVMERGVEFRMPDGTILAAATSGPAVLQISGDNVTIHGDFVVNGNKANNDSAGFGTGIRNGSFHITGDNCQIFGEAKVIDAYFRGLTVGDTHVFGTEVQKFYASKITVENSNYFSVVLWSVVDWNIGEIWASTNSPFVYEEWMAFGRDHRITTGNQGSSTTVCARGHIGYIHTDINTSFVGETHTIDVSIDSVLTGNGGKLEDCVNVQIGLWNAYDCSRQDQRTAFFMHECYNCTVDSILVQKFDCNPVLFVPAIEFDDVTSCSVGSIVSIGNKSNFPNFEVLIRQADGLHIDSIMLRNPVGTCYGFHYDHGYPLQRDITIDSLISRGHTNWDVIVEDRTAITIGRINPDATNLYPTNTDSLTVSGDWTPSFSTSGTPFSAATYAAQTSGYYLRVGKVVHFAGQIRSNSIVTAGSTGFVVLAGLPFTAKAGPYWAVSLASCSGFAGDVPINARVVPNTKTIELFYRVSANTFDDNLAIADLATGAGANSMNFSGTYELLP